jgi:DNA mismatch repair protein MutS
LDEIGRGTSTYDGISIAWSISEFLHNNPAVQPKTLFATHYHELNELAERFERIKNYNVSTKEMNNKVIFLRKLKEGGSKHSFGIHVAKMAGMPRSVVERSAEILKELEQKSIDTGNLDQKVRQLSAPVQLSFFDAETDPKLLEVQEALEDLDPNQLTPIECMLKLDELKKMLD